MTKRYYLSVDYEECNTKSYKGIVIRESRDEDFKEIIRVNTGSVELDERRALHKLYDLVGEVNVQYMSSYDHYFMDFDYEHDPEVRTSVDKMNKEQDEKIDNYKREIGKSEE